MLQNTYTSLILSKIANFQDNSKNKIKFIFRKFMKLILNNIAFEKKN